MSCAIFLTAVLPFLILNFITYHNSDREDYIFQVHHANAHFSGKVKQRFLQYVKNRSSVDVDWWRRNDSDLDIGKAFYAKEQQLAKQLADANAKYEKACSDKLKAYEDLQSSQNKTEKQSIIKSKYPQWQKRLTKCKDIEKTKFFLTSALQVRIYKADKAKWTIKELKQWLHYMFWAGIEHVYVCDHYRFTSESLLYSLKQYIDANLVTYIAWNHIRIPMTAQVSCYQYIIDEFGADAVWQIAVDMDEYPFMPNDTNENFLSRYLKSLSFSVTEVSMHNFLMLGHGNRSRTMAIERITRMTPEPANELDKPMYRPNRVIASIHHNQIKHGKRLEADGEQIRLLHYWGSRINHFGPDTPEILVKTIEYTALRDSLSNTIRQSLIGFGELDAFSNSTGP